MAGRYVSEIELRTNIEKVLSQLKETQDKVDKLDGKEYKVNLDIDTKTLEITIQKLDKMLDSLGKGTGDFKQLENLSKELSEITFEVKNFSKAFGKLDDSGAKTLLSSIQSIDRSLSDLSKHIIGVNKNMGNMGNNASGAVKQVENIGNAAADAVKQVDKLADAQSKLGNKTNISSGMKDAFQGEKTDNAKASAKEEKASKLERQKALVKELNYALKEYSGLQTKIAKGLGITEDVSESEKLLNTIHELQRNELLPSEKLNESNEKLKEIRENVSKIKQGLVNSYDKNSESYDSKLTRYQATAKRFANGGWESDTYKENLKSLDNALNSYKNTLASIKSHPDTITDEEIKNMQKYEALIKQYISAISNMSAAEKGFTFLSGQKALTKIGSLLDENSKMSRTAKAQIKAYYNEIKSGNPSASLDVILGKVQEIVNAETEAGRGGKSMWAAIKEKTWYGVAGTLGTYFGLNDIVQYGKQAINTIIELDDALVDLKKTTTMSSSELQNFYFDSNDVAKQMGVTTQAIIDQASQWSRLGYSTKEQATEMAKLSSQFASISPGMDTDQSQSGLISIMKAWNIDPKDVKSKIMDPINQLGNTMAESNDDIVEGMKRSAAALAAVGTSTEDAFSLFSGIQEVLQNAEVSGRALRSISMRIRGYDESSEDGFEQTDEELKNITGDLVDLTKTAEHTQGISVFKPGSTTEFKSLVDYFGEIHDIWNEMSQKQQNDFLQKAFGKTQAQAGSALIQNYDAVKKSLEEIEKSSGSADKEMSTVESSLSYKINALKETWVGACQDIVDRGDLGKIITAFTKLSEGITFVTSKLGLLKTLALGLTAALSFNNVGRDKMYSLTCFKYADNIHNLLWIHRFRVC
mgnify:CR=1 FL=1|jgi:TP901 family phage tail tape measure protein